MTSTVRGRRAAPRSVAYPVLLFLAALDAAGYSVIGPIVPVISRTTGAGPALIGALVATFPLGILIGFPIAGRMIQRRSPERTLVASLVLVALGCGGFVFSSELPAYMLSRFLMGIGSGGIWMGVAFATLERWPDQGYLCMSRVFAAYSVGGLVGPALGAIGGVRGPFLAYLALLGVGLILVPVMGSPPERRPFRSDRSALRLPGFWLASAAILFVVLALGVIEGVLPLHFAGRLRQEEIAALYVGMSVIVGVGAAAAGRLRPWPVVLAAMASIVGGLSIVGATDSISLWIGLLALAGLGIGLGNTGAIGILLEAVPADRIMTAMVVWSQLGIAGYLAGPLVGGSVAEVLGFAAVGLVPAAAAFGVLAVFVWTPRSGSSARRAP